MASHFVRVISIDAAIIKQMCARYRLKISLRYIAEILGMSWTEFEEFSEKPRLNIQISQRVPIVRMEDGQKKLTMAEWGFIAPWDKKTRLFNAVGETLSVKRTFSESFKDRRCLIPADGFYEWPGKQTTLIHYSDDRPFCFAGLWLSDTVTMITCAPNDFMRPIHHRMPVILQTTDYETWLDPKSTPEKLQTLTATRLWSEVEAVPVQKLISEKPAN